tara:strand:+ start:1708 stop:2202 length:495 start_codon:yes stop_codon:yes gene_type:complete
MSTKTKLTLRDHLQDFYNSFEGEKRENNSFYFFLKDESKNKYQELVRELHMDELPNDWRYETIKNLVSSFLEYYADDEELTYDNLQDALRESIVENLADYSTSCLFKWLAEMPSRAAFEDMSLVIGVMDDSVDLAYLARLRQIEEIEIMGSNLLYHFDQLINQL